MRSTATGDRYRVVVFDINTRQKVHESDGISRLACAKAKRDEWRAKGYNAVVKVD